MVSTVYLLASSSARVVLQTHKSTMAQQIEKFELAMMLKPRNSKG
jgi:hypothetical protein